MSTSPASRTPRRSANLSPDSSETAQTKKTIHLHPHQIQAYQADEKPEIRTIALVGGTGSGKTWFGPHWVWKRLRNRPGSRLFAIGMGYEKHIERVMQYELMRFFESIGVKAQLKVHKSIMLPNGAEILFGSSENPSSLEGPHVDGGAWIDEAGLMPRLAWDVVQRRTGFHNAPILITTIPYVMGWLKTDVYDAFMAGERSIEWIHCRTEDNPDYSDVEIERRRKKMRPEHFQIMYEGEFAKPFGMIYPDPDDSAILVEPFDVPEDWPCFAGHDFGFNAPTTGVWGRLDPNEDVLYIVGEYEAAGATIEDHIVQWQMLGLDVVDLAWGDPANPEVWESATRAGYPVLRGENNINFGINCVYDRLKSGRLKVFRGVKTLLDYRAQYVWATDSKDTEVLLDKPKKPQPAEHLMDGLRYLCAGLVVEGLAAPPGVLSVTSRQLA